MDNEQTPPPPVNGADHNGDETNGGPTNDMPAPPKILNVAFKHQNGQELHFKMKTTTKLGKAMDGFASRMQREAGSMRFLLDGERINKDQTFEDLGVDEDCQVEAFEEQIGGGS